VSEEQQPSVEALEFVLSRLEVKSSELDGVPFWYVNINGTCLMVKDIKAACDMAWRVLRQEVTALCQEYANKKVTEERERIARGLENDLKFLHNSYGAAQQRAIEIVKGEGVSDDPQAATAP
jgi:hypothetical protein